MHSALEKEGGRDTVKRQIMEHLMLLGAFFQVINAQGLQPIHLACRAGYVRCIQLLVERQADASTKTLGGQTCLHLACKSNHSEVAQLLIQVSPQSLNISDAEGNTALHVCASHGSLD